jgi:hypothetical protein
VTNKESVEDPTGKQRSLYRVEEAGLDQLLLMLPSSSAQAPRLIAWHSAPVVITLERTLPQNYIPGRFRLKTAYLTEPIPMELTGPQGGRRPVRRVSLEFDAPKREMTIVLDWRECRLNRFGDAEAGAGGGVAQFRSPCTISEHGTYRDVYVKKSPVKDVDFVLRLPTATQGGYGERLWLLGGGEAGYGEWILEPADAPG